MTINNVKTIAVHDGNFHTDDVFAVAIMKLVYSKVKIIRTRDENKLKKAHIRIDVGRKYNPENGDFDHHQKEFTRKRENNIPYASTGLIWEHFGNKLVNSKEAFDYIDEILIQPIDAHDSGLNINGIIKPYTINNIISLFMPDWKSEVQNYDKSFDDAIDFAVSILKKEIKVANGLKEERDFIKKIASKGSEDYLVFENEPPNWKSILLDYSKIKYVIYKSPNRNWNSEGCRIKKDSFEIRKPFPIEWADLTNKQLIKVTGVKDAVFCHRARFIVVAKSKEGAIKLTELALKQ